MRNLCNRLNGTLQTSFSEIPLTSHTGRPPIQRNLQSRLICDQSRPICDRLGVDPPHFSSQSPFDKAFEPIPNIVEYTNDPTYDRLNNEVYIQSIASLNAEFKETMDTYLNLESTPNIDACIEHQ